MLAIFAIALTTVAATSPATTIHQSMQNVYLFVDTLRNLNGFDASVIEGWDELTEI